MEAVVVSRTSTLKRMGIGAAIGSVVGFIVSSLAGPSVISWWYEPPSRDAFSCAGSVKIALSQFVMMQLMSAGVGAVGLAVLLFVLGRAKITESGAPRNPQ